MWSRYLLWFAHEHVDFRYAEIQSICSLFDIAIRFIEKPSTRKPYWIIEAATEENVKKIASRSILVKNCFELWGYAKSDFQLHLNLKKSLQNNSGKWITDNICDISHKCQQICPSLLIEECSSAKKSFKVEVETFCKHFSMKEKIKKIEGFDYLPFTGPVNLKNPDIRLAYLEFYGDDPNNVPEKPYDVFFGRQVADGQRDLMKYHSLKKRHFIGNTSMDAQLSIIMANQAQVKDGDLVLDPFVGSGSLLVAAAHFGGYVWGSDIDYMMLHGKTRPTRVGQKVRAKDESIRANMRQYHTESKYLDTVVSDFSMPLWREGLKLDSIITDPPYGVREPAEKIGIERDNYTLSEQHLVNHVPAKVEYGLPHIYRDLLDFAARHLALGKRLVCWYPLVREEYQEDHIPVHPCLRLVANSEQILSKITSRRLLTYEKINDEVLDVQDPNTGIYNFREKYFAIGDLSRREKKKEKQAEIMVANAFRSLAKLSDVT